MRLSLALLLMQLVTHSTLLAQPRLDKHGWNCVFSDDFDTDPLTRPNDWSPQFTFGNFLGGQTFLTTNVVHSNQGGQGQVRLKCRPQPTLTNTMVDIGGGVLEPRANVFNSGMLRSTYDDFLHGGGVYSTNPGAYPDGIRGGWLYGMFEVRCKLPKHRAATPAIWMSGNNTWPPELDIIETSKTYENDPADPVNSPGNFKHVVSSIHWGTPNAIDPTKTDHNICWSNMDFPQSLTDEFHTWTMVWTPYEVAYFLDGVEMKTIKEPIQIPGHYLELLNDPSSTLNNRMMDIIINNSTNAKERIQDNEIWQMYHDMGITDLSDLIVDKVEVYRPAGMSRATTQYPYHEPLPYNVSNSGAFENFVRFRLLPMYFNTPFRAENGWKQEYVGWDLVEYPLGASNYTTDYKIVGKPVVTKGTDEGFLVLEKLLRTSCHIRVGPSA